MNWFEAQAYCNWLSAVTRHSYQLPTELEWEKAARNSDGRAYPWDGKFSSAASNTLESHFYTSTPVGLYLNGVSPYGLFDCSGNVWEWTQSYNQAFPESAVTSDDFGERFYVVRRGSWNNNRRNAHCAYRNRNVPDYFNFTLGFRILSPGVFLDSAC
ncbi:MAG TPA: formylglycine-generating enzyme family protein [Anaerolineales bacterium]|nr:formylglycine-generating enzyme family protein [Anaerolineales bacterium]